MPKISCIYGTVYIVILYCILLILSFDMMVRSEDVDFQNTNTHLSPYKSNKNLLQQSHPSLKHIKLSENMKSLLKDLRDRRKKRTWQKRDVEHELPKQVYVIKDNQLVPLTPLRENPTRYASQRSTTTQTSAQTQSVLKSSTVNSVNTHTSLVSRKETTTTNKHEHFDVVINNVISPQVPITLAPSNALKKRTQSNYIVDPKLENAEQYLDDNIFVPVKHVAEIKLRSPAAKHVSKKTSNQPRSTTERSGSREKQVHLTDELEYSKFMNDVASKVYEKLVTNFKGIKRTSRQFQNDNVSETSALEKILGEVEEIKQLVVLKENHKPNFACRLNGSWLSEVGGKRIDISLTNNTALVTLAERTPQKRLVQGFLGDCNWTMNGLVPFPKSGVIILTGVHAQDRRVAAFVGECKYCESETVTGHWLLGRTSYDCKDQKASQQLLSDIWRRENLHTLRQQRLAELNRKGS